MDFLDQIHALGAKVARLQEHIKTEQASKQAFVIPFIQVLGYDVFDPAEVVPEYIADVGIKKGEKIDYAIMQDGHPIILVECKWAGGNLKEAYGNQLYRYFSVTKARIAILTNGLLYKFYTDLDEPNKMDSKPFLEFNLLDIQEPAVSELQKITKTGFNLEGVLSAAVELKYVNEVKQLFEQQLAQPDEELIRFFAGRLVQGTRFTAAVKEQYGALVKRALNQFITDKISNRLKSALNSESISASILVQEVAMTADIQVDEEDKSEIVTTPEEIEGFTIIRALVRDVIPVARVTARDAKSYFAVIIDNNNRRPLARLYFNRAQKYLGVFDANKVETKIKLSGLDDLYNHAEPLRAMAATYTKQKVEAEPADAKEPVLAGVEIQNG